MKLWCGHISVKLYMPVIKSYKPNRLREHRPDELASQFASNYNIAGTGLPNFVECCNRRNETSGSDACQAAALKHHITNSIMQSDPVRLQHTMNIF